MTDERTEELTPTGVGAGSLPFVLGGRPITNDAAAPVLRRARDAALLTERRLQLAFDGRTRTYRLAVVGSPA